MMRKFMIAAIVLAGIIGGARAAPPATPAGFVDGLVNQAIDTIKDQTLSDSVREQRFDGLVERSFDMPRIARYVLGRYWLAASEEDRQAFAQLFRRWVIRTYAMRFRGYSGEQVRVLGTRPEGDGSVVTTEIVSPTGAPPMKLDWRVAGHDGAYKILDVDVEGVSMALTEREEISSAIERNGGTVASLNRAFAAKLGDAATADAGTH
jgi:phospholipid transport system substrate-binding protein